MVGLWPSGDFRRSIYADPLGMHAANFTTMSTGIGSYSNSIRDKYFYEYPREFKIMVDAGLMYRLPRTKATEEKPAHQYNVQHVMSSSIIVDSMSPRQSAQMAGIDDYMSDMTWAVNPLDRYYAECVNSWNQYQSDWKRQGFEHEYVPYPYSLDDVNKWFEQYRQTVGPTSTAEKRAWIAAHQETQERATAENKDMPENQPWDREDRLNGGMRILQG